MSRSGVYPVAEFGAFGDGVHLDTDAINAAIRAAHGAGGGRVILPPGRYLSFSIQIRSRVTLEIAKGAVLVAASPEAHGGQYDPPEPNPHDAWQDFGHSHWHNSLIWGEDVEDIALVGGGLILGQGLTREGPGARWSREHIGDRPLSMGTAVPLSPEQFVAEQAAMIGQGNKAVALKNARNVLIKDLTVLMGGHFAFLLTGVEGLTMSRLTIDTNRDGIDLDCVQDARLSDLKINSPNDDAIVLKASLALGEIRPTQRISITRCKVTGFDPGTMLDETFGRSQDLSPDQDRVTGRIKIGTESNGDFRDIVISDCVFQRSRGLAIESVDGGVIEDIQVRNIEMDEVTTAPLFLRLGNRARGPEGTPVGRIRRVTIENLNARGIDHRYAATLAGLPDQPITDIVLRNLNLSYLGGGSILDARRSVPELEQAYPEPSMFGTSPAFGLFARHVQGLTLESVNLGTLSEDGRPDITLVNVSDYSRS